MIDPDSPKTQQSNKIQYRLQLPPDGRWTEWRDIDALIPETHVLSMQVSEWISKDKYDRFMSQFIVSIS